MKINKLDLPPTRYMHEAICQYLIKKDSRGRFSHYSEKMNEICGFLNGEF
jgi:hypothetical protein